MSLERTRSVLPLLALAAGLAAIAWLAQVPIFYLLSDEAPWLLAYWSISAAALAVVVAVVLHRMFGSSGVLVLRLVLG
ncbi:hypothetical protein LCGC14_2006410, partial [marine sediment metagenome]